MLQITNGISSEQLLKLLKGECWYLEINCDNDIYNKFINLHTCMYDGKDYFNNNLLRDPLIPKTKCTDDYTDETKMRLALVAEFIGSDFKGLFIGGINVIGGNVYMRINPPLKKNDRFGYKFEIHYSAHNVYFSEDDNYFGGNWYFNAVSNYLNSNGEKECELWCKIKNEFDIFYKNLLENKVM
jgi:hypothetical protein